MKENNNKRALEPGQEFVVSFIFQEEDGRIQMGTDTYGLYESLKENPEMSDGEITMRLQNVIYGVYHDCYHKNGNVVILNWWLF